MQPLSAAVTVSVGAGAYGASSCGAAASRPLVVVGPGSGAASVDCNGTARVITSSAALSLSGLTLLAGAASAAVAAGGSTLAQGCAAAGGGAVCVVWPPDAAGPAAQAVFTDVVFRGSVATVAVNTSYPRDTAAMALAGGGAVFVAGGGEGAGVAVSGCVFEANNARLTYASGSDIVPAPCGGALCVVLGAGTSSGAGDAAGVSVTVVDTQVRCARLAMGGLGWDVLLLPAWRRPGKGFWCTRLRGHGAIPAF